MILQQINFLIPTSGLGLFNVTWNILLKISLFLMNVAHLFQWISKAARRTNHGKLTCCVSLFPTIQWRLGHCVKDFDLVVTTHKAHQNVYSKMKRWVSKWSEQNPSCGLVNYYGSLKAAVKWWILMALLSYVMGFFHVYAKTLCH